MTVSEYKTTREEPRIEHQIGASVRNETKFKLLCAPLGLLCIAANH